MRVPSSTCSNFTSSIKVFINFKPQPRLPSGLDFRRAFLSRQTQAAIGNRDDDFIVFDGEFLVDFAVGTQRMFGRVDAGFDQRGFDLVDRFRREMMTAAISSTVCAAINSVSSPIGTIISYSFAFLFRQTSFGAEKFDQQFDLFAARTESVSVAQNFDASGEKPSGATSQILYFRKLHISATISRRSHQNSPSSFVASSFESISAAIQTVSSSSV
jgi:hypothetical protein